MIPIPTRIRNPLMVGMLLVLILILSSLAYASPFNVTHDPINDSYFLENGVTSSFADTQFLTNTTLFLELSDMNNGTFFSLINNSYNASFSELFQDHDEIADSTTNDLNSNDEGYFNEINITKTNAIQNIEFCFESASVGGTPQINISIAYNVSDFPIVLNGFNSLAPNSRVCENVSSEYFDLFDQQNFYIGVFCIACDNTNKLKIARDNNGIREWKYDAGWTLNPVNTLIYNTTITYAPESNIDGDALSLLFNVTFDTTFSYWLQTVRTTNGSTNGVVHTYSTQDQVNETSKTVSSIAEGTSVIPLDGIISTGMVNRLRFYTTDASDIAEITLIEELIDLEDPVLNYELNPEIDIKLEDLVIDAECTDNRNLSFFRMHIFNSSQTIYDETNTSINTDTILTLGETIPAVGLGLGTYNRNTTCVDENLNTVSIQDVITVVNESAPDITLLSPSDGATVQIVDYPSQTNEVQFTWSTNQNADCDLLIDNVVTDTIINQQSFTGVGIFPSNTLVDWFVNCTTTGKNLTAQSETRELTILHVADTAFYNRNVCPANSLGGTILFIFLILFGFFIFFFAGTIGFKVLSIMGGIMVMLAGTYIFSCAIIFGLITTLMGLLLITRAVIR